MKKKLWRLFLMVWVVVCGIYYCSGRRGVFEIRSLQELNKQLGLEVVALENRVGLLQTQIEAWSQEPFFKEKLAREQLQLAYPEDIIYYVVDET
jgi:cell division protein FtsB